ncbi:MAG: phage antirepressor KilAC domain-containing protein [Nocardiaceae bacterium]|nr:phage antirepressor KilAC domain-containing protein [Nocardiaceae bacterium]
MSTQDSTAIVPFNYSGSDVRSLTIDGDPWFIAADSLALLELNRSSLTALDDDEKGVHTMDTPGGVQSVGIISEAGFYSLILRSRKPEAKQIRRWLTHEVLPAIRKTGAYSTAPALTDDQLIHRALEVSARRVSELTERLAEVEPIAEKFLNAEGDYAFKDAADALTRAGIKVGQNRLFSLVASKYRWIYRSEADRKWRVYNAAIEAGWVSVIPQSHYHPKTGILVLDAPQPRLTPKGMQRILRDHGGDNIPAVSA